MSNHWFRCHNEIINDPKIRILAFEDRWHFIALCCLKSSGELDKEYSDELKERFISVQLGITIVDLCSIKKRLIEVDLINNDWQPCGWNKRQYISDKIDPTAAARQKKYRKNKKLKERYGSVTDELRPELDTELELEDKSITQTKGFAEWWKLYPRKKEKQKALAIWKRKGFGKISTTLIDKLKDQLENCESFDRDMTKIAYPTTYLNGGRYDDPVEQKQLNGSSDNKAAMRAEMIERISKGRDGSHKWRSEEARKLLGELVGRNRINWTGNSFEINQAISEVLT